MKLFTDAPSLIYKILALSTISVFLLTTSLWAQSESPTVNGLFHAPTNSEGEIDFENGTPDSELYDLFGIGDRGSKLYTNITNDTLYVALVVSRDVNDNVFALNRGQDREYEDYLETAGWDSGGNLHFTRRVDSEYAGFNLMVGTENGDNGSEDWEWKQGYAGQENNGDVDRREATWISNTEVSGGDEAETPPGYQSASSIAWNMNRYAKGLDDDNNKVNNWTMPGDDTDSDTWVSPWKGAEEDDDTETVIDPDEGYPETGPITFSETYNWEWSMIYEWSVDLSQMESTNIISLTSNTSHHSPAKDGDEDEAVPDDSLLAAVGNYVWLDKDEDGIQGEEDPGVEGVRVNLLDSDENTVKDEDGDPITTTTNNDGFYWFTELEPGDYKVEFELPENFYFTEQNVGDDTQVDSEADEDTGITREFTLDRGDIRTNMDAGLVETLEVTLTGDSCWRTLTSPIDGQTYQEFFASFEDDGLYTQGEGITGVRHDGGIPNVYKMNNDGDDWTPVPDLTEEIPAGEGFLMTVFTDDVFEEEGEWPKTATFDNNETIYEAPVNVDLQATDSDSFNLLGNPFSSSIDFDELNTSEITGIVWVYDRDQDEWVTWNGDVGDLEDGIIAPFQGFVVQNDENAENPSVEFTEASKTNETGTGFLGREIHNYEYVRLELDGEGLNNSMWLQFSGDGSSDRTSGDAIQMMPFEENYAVFSARKEKDYLLDIGHFPSTSTEDLEIPVNVDVSKEGTYTISTTDFDLTGNHGLYLHDLQEQKTVEIRPDMEYSFSIEGSNAKHTTQISSNECFAEPQKLQTSVTDRFVISNSDANLTSSDSESEEADLPDEVQLSQNYPNPFNPVTQISFELPQSGEVSLEVYDMTGQHIETLLDGHIQAGVHELSFDGSNLASGVYIYRLKTDDTVISNTMTLIK